MKELKALTIKSPIWSVFFTKGEISLRGKLDDGPKWKSTEFHWLFC